MQNGAKQGLIEILEILGSSEQGFARPYRCRGEDGKLYYVKGMQSDRKSLYKEWLCGYLALQVGLNIPPFRAVNISEDLLRETPSELRDIGPGPAFGSQEHAPAVWLEPTSTALVDVANRQLILAFDWWIANGDRTKGNSNLLYDQVNKKVVVIDHNNALDRDIDFDVFLDTHIFGDERAHVFNDLVTISELQTKFSAASAGLEAWLQQAPEEWQWINPECDVPTNFDGQSAVQILAHRAANLINGGAYG